MSVPARRLAPASPRPAPRPRLRVVRSRTTRKRWSRGTKLGMVCGGMLLGVIVGVLLIQVALAQSAFTLAELRTDLTEEEDRHEELLLEAATLESPGRIESFARKRLGMIDPHGAAIEYIVADVRTGPGAGGNRAPSEAEAAAAAAAISEATP